MRIVQLREALRKVCLLAVASAACAFATWVVAPSATETAAANGDTRTLHLYHTHTGETIDATFRVDGQYDPSVLRQLNHFLRDWRNNDEISMDPRLFDAIWEAYRSAGATDRIQIYSAYRSPETNAMLRRRSKAVAEHSQHMLGKAMDTTMPGFPMERIRDAGMKLQNGGVGWYPSANFVHIDVGGVRSWPRMPYDQLASLFPDGKTVHIASNGQTLPGYEQARAELAQRGGAELPPAQNSGGFFAWLFGGGNSAGAAREDEEDRRTAVAAAPQPAPVQPAPVQAAPEPAPAPVAPVQVAAQPAPQDQPTAAIAYASVQSQPLDERAHVEGQGMEGQRIEVESQQVASLEPADGAVATLGNDLPLPPRRPAGLAAAPEIPLPPSRPDALAAMRTASTSQHLYVTSHDAIGGLIMATASGLPALRRSALPSVITQGGRAPLPGRALAFAAPDVVDTDGPQDRVRAAGPSANQSLALRVVRVRSRPQPAATEARDIPAAASDAMAGPRLTGLRRAARLMSQKASL